MLKIYRILYRDGPAAVYEIFPKRGRTQNRTEAQRINEQAQYRLRREGSGYRITNGPTHKGEYFPLLTQLIDAISPESGTVIAVLEN